MLLHLATITFWALTGFAAINALCAALTLVVLFFRRSEPAVDEELPRVAVLLCLRGADPNLSAGLQRLMNQRYPSYEIFIAIDSDSDPAWDVVNQTISASTAAGSPWPLSLQGGAGEGGASADAPGQPGACNVHVSTLRNRLKTCGLKCSSLVQLLDQIDDSFEAVVLADSDLESHSTWLRELVTPLADPRIGATFGNRWFLPSAGSMGSLVRQVCNAIGVVTMHLGQIPWGGSLAIRTSVIRESGLRQTLTRSIVDDGPVRVALKNKRMKLRFVPSLMMANREDCDLKFAHGFLTRQLKWTRTYMSDWWPVMLAYTLGVLGTYVAALVMALVCALRGSSTEALWFAAAATVYSVTVMALWLLLDFAARRIIRAQGEPAPSMFGTQLLKIPVAMLLSVVIHISAMIRATFVRRVVWRGVTYEVHGPSHVRLLDERSPQPALDACNVSL